MDKYIPHGTRWSLSAPCWCQDHATTLALATARPKGVMPNSEQASQGPPGLVAPGVKKAAPMTADDIADVIKAFADAAAVAKAVGFDGVELHGPMVTPLIQILWQGTNQQANAFDGDMKARRGFAEEILKENSRHLIRRALFVAEPVTIHLPLPER